MEIRPDELGVAQRYKILTGVVVPRPIAFVSTLSPAGVANLAPYSFFNGVGSNPMVLAFCPANDPAGREKDTLANCKPRGEGGTGEFVVNVAAFPYRRQVAAAAEPLPPDESEFDLTGLATAPSRVVAPPRVEAAPAAFECRTLEVVRTNPGAPAGGNVVLGEVVWIHLRDDIVDERFRIDPDRLAAIGRLAGSTYCTTDRRFEMPRGRGALDLPDA